MFSQKLPLQSGEGITWRRRNESDGALPNLVTTTGFVAGQNRCLATNLLRGDCPMHRRPDSSYCYYHQKLAKGLLEPHISTVRVEREEFDQRTGRRIVRNRIVAQTRVDCYPVYPLPTEGYILLGGTATS